MSSLQTNGKAKRALTSTTILVRGATETPIASVTEIDDIEIRTIPVRIVGSSQLIVNNFGAKGRQQLEDTRARSEEERRADKKLGKKPITPEEIERMWQAARVLNSKGQDCIRAAWIKGALLTAGKYAEIGIPSTRLKGALFVEGDLLPISFKSRAPSESDETTTYFGKGLPGRRADIVRVGKFGAKQPDVRYRPCYDDWSVSFKLTFEPKLISMSGLAHLVRRAGMSVGLCEWRPEGPGGGKGGQYGRFDLDLVKS